MSNAPKRVRRRAVASSLVYAILQLGILNSTYFGPHLLFAGEAVPDEAKPSFLESIQCALCHANSSRAIAMRDHAEQGIAPFDLWRTSSMANSTRDPFWRAQLSAEVAATPSQKAAIEEKCTRCHAPMAAPAPESPPGQILTHLAADDERSWLGMDGVSCTLCHQIRSEGLGDDSSFTGHFKLGAKGPIYGPHADPFPMPMRNHTGYTPTFSRHVLNSGLCGTCHTLNTRALNPDGSATGHMLHEQSPYLEWRNSVFNDEIDDHGDEAKSCQGCHMPTDDRQGREFKTRLAHNPGGRDFPFLKARSPFGQHTFYGGNVFLTRLLLANHKELHVSAPKEALERRLKAATEFLERQSAKLTIGRPHEVEGRWAIPVEVKNLAGHKLPTAYPSRRVWIRLEVRDRNDELLFASGQFDQRGRLIDQQGNVLRSELPGAAILPHYQQVESSDQVQVYQSVMADTNGEPTFTLLRGAQYAKDNRLLPAGWLPTHADGPATAPVGVAGDRDFGNGEDRLEYHVAIPAGTPVRVQAWLHYQVVSPRHAHELFRVETPQVQEFRSLYRNMHLAPETLATATRETAPPLP